MALNCCIALRQRVAAAAAAGRAPQPLGGALPPFDAGTGAVQQQGQQQQHGGEREGAVEPAVGLFCLQGGGQMYAPGTQEPPVMTSAQVSPLPSWTPGGGIFGGSDGRAKGRTGAGWWCCTVHAESSTTWTTLPAALRTHTVTHGSPHTYTHAAHTQHTRAPATGSPRAGAVRAARRPGPAGQTSVVRHGGVQGCKPRGGPGRLWPLA